MSPPTPTTAPDFSQKPWHPLHYLPASAHSVLDLGCNVGDLLVDLQRLRVPRLHGMDVNAAAVARARERLGPGAEVVAGSADRLPWADGSMDTVFCLEVLEHIPEQLRVPALAEVHRVLAPQGRLVLSVPHAGLFAPLDPANARLRAPGLFRWASQLLGGRGREAGYASGEADIVWHHHFTLGELRALLEPRFAVRQLRWRGGLLAPLGHWLEWPFYRLRRADHPIMRGIQRIIERDYAIPQGERLAYDVLLVMERL